MAAPEHAPVLLGAAILGGVLGALAAWRNVLWHPPPPVSASSRSSRASASVGWTRRNVAFDSEAWWPGSPRLDQDCRSRPTSTRWRTVAPGQRESTVAGLALVNRLTRLVPVTLVFAALHPVAQSSGWSPALLAAVYATGWIVFYAAYWIARDPRRGG